MVVSWEGLGGDSVMGGIRVVVSWEGLGGDSVMGGVRVVVSWEGLGGNSVMGGVGPARNGWVVVSLEELG